MLLAPSSHTVQPSSILDRARALARPCLRPPRSPFTVQDKDIGAWGLGTVGKE
jgi:hypothetical protein